MNQIQGIPEIFNTSVTLFNLLVWIVFGLVVGAIAELFDPNPSFSGLLGTITLGILGAILGGFISNFIFHTPGITGLNLNSLIVAFIGALLLLIIRRLFIHNGGHIKTTTEHK